MFFILCILNYLYRDMIRTEQNLRECLQKECGQIHNLFGFVATCTKMFIHGNEQLPAYEVLYTLRRYEFYLNQEKLGVVGRIKKFFWHFLFRNRQLKHSIFIEPNCVGEGTTLMHPGFRKIPKFVRIGMNSTILPMVLIGKRKPGMDELTVIGDNCYISTGVTILSPVRIGDNVVIGAGAVVTKDIPDNTVVAGVPALKIGESL